MKVEVEFLKGIYNQYKEFRLPNRRFKFNEYLDLLENLYQIPWLQINTEGFSAMGKPIYSIRMGTGKLRVMVWTQMHGNEPTGTAALFDWFNFIRSEHGAELRELLMRELTILFVPLVNPDGAEMFTRRNAQYIDINRDALQRQSPEAQLLIQLRNSFSPEWGFNMHDQDTHYSVGSTQLPATISFLAPTYNTAKDIDQRRAATINLISTLIPVVNSFQPGIVARYYDSWDARCFGDHFQAVGTNTLLVESGGYYNDNEKQTARFLNFLIYSVALQNLATGNFMQDGQPLYFSLPENGKNYFDYLIKNVSYTPMYGQKQKVDIAINRVEFEANGDFYSSTFIADLGDLSNQRAFETIDGTAMEVSVAGVFADTLDNISQIEALSRRNLYAQGISYIRVKNIEKADQRFVPDFTISDAASFRLPTLKPESYADLVFRKADTVELLFIGGKKIVL